MMSQIQMNRIFLYGYYGNNWWLISRSSQFSIHLMSLMGHKIDADALTYHEAMQNTHNEGYYKVMQVEVAQLEQHQMWEFCNYATLLLVQVYYPGQAKMLSQWQSNANLRHTSVSMGTNKLKSLTSSKHICWVVSWTAAHSMFALSLMLGIARNKTSGLCKSFCSSQVKRNCLHGIT